MYHRITEVILLDYKKYQNSRDLAWEILYRENIRSLPVDVLGICKRLGIEVRQYATPRPMLEDGFSCAIGERHCIFIYAGQSPQRRRFTVAHELGHILLGHVGKYQFVNRELSPSDNFIEREANVFAARLLAPACVLRECRVSSAAEIAEMCDISLSAAKIRWERMQLLIARDRFYSSPLERRVYLRFKKYIKSYRRGR